MTQAIQKKVCMLGAFAVGKTSLVRRFVQSVFSDNYLSTVGVKIDKKTVQMPERAVNLILWDVAGEDDIAALRMSYLRGSAGYVLVADGTRQATLEVALSLQERVQVELGVLPFVFLLNKSDIREQWTISDADIAQLREKSWHLAASSARSGEGVEEAFTDLALRITR